MHGTGAVTTILGSAVRGIGTPGPIHLGHITDGMTRGTTEDFTIHGTTEDGILIGAAITFTTTTLPCLFITKTIGTAAVDRPVLTVYSLAEFPPGGV